jgi:iron(III) transport system ATP-binding protein
MPSDACEVSLEAVNKFYTRGKRALCDLTVKVDPGEFVVLLGPSGSGKTTLLRSIAGIERISSGTITIGGVAVSSGSNLHLPPERRGLAMVFQDYALWPHMRVKENVAFALARTKQNRSTCLAMALEMLERVGLSRHADKYPNELSGGEQQRVALARALVAQLGLVLFDEPLSNLDADLRERMRIEIGTLSRLSGATAIYITHDQSEAFALADKIGVLEHGRLVQFGVPESIYNQPASEFVARFTGVSGDIKAVIGEHVAPGIVQVAVPHSSGGRILAKNLSNAQQGSEVSLLFRPSALRIVDTNNENATLLATVTDVAFRGRGYDVALRLQDGSHLNSIYSDHRMKLNESVGLRIDPVGCFVFGGRTSLLDSQSIPSHHPLHEKETVA